MPIQFVLYGRVYCHLCDDMEQALVRLLKEIGSGREFEIEVVDVDTDPVLERQFDERVPVLFADGQELCHHFLDPASVRAYLSEIH